MLGHLIFSVQCHFWQYLNNCYFLVHMLTFDVRKPISPPLRFWALQQWMGLMKNKYQLDATYYFIILLIGSTCFGH